MVVTLPEEFIEMEPHDENSYQKCCDDTETTGSLSLHGDQSHGEQSQSSHPPPRPALEAPVREEPTREADNTLDLSRTTAAIGHYVDERVATFQKNMVTLGMMLTGKCDPTLEIKEKKLFRKEIGKDGKVKAQVVML